MSDLFPQAMVMIPNKDGAAIVGPFPDMTAGWAWIDWHNKELPPVGVIAVALIPPDTAIELLKADGRL